ncbi:hypothetical protein ACPJHQ_09295 [Rossellomorea sp. H39__3]
MNHLGILTLNPDPANPFYSGLGKESLSYPIHLHLFSRRTSLLYRRN